MTPKPIKVRVDLELTPQQAVEATQRALYVDEEVFSSMPVDTKEEVEIHFFRLGYWASELEVIDAYAKRGLKPASASALSKALNDNPSVFDRLITVTCWKNAEQKWCLLMFMPVKAEHRAIVGMRTKVVDDAVFAGVPI